MLKAKLSQVIDADLEHAFHVVSALQMYPVWNPAAQRIVKLKDSPDGGEVGEGATFSVTMTGFWTQKLYVKDFNKYQKICFVPDSKIFSGSHLFVFSEENGKTRIDHSIEVYPKGLFRIFSPFINLYVKKVFKNSSEALKKYAES